MFEIKLKTSYKDGRQVETTATAEHFVAFEEHFDMAVADAITTTKLTYWYYMSWLTAQSGLEFKDWLATMRDIDPEVVDIPPFGSATSAETSPS